MSYAAKVKDFRGHILADLDCLATLAALADETVSRLGAKGWPAPDETHINFDTYADEVDIPVGWSRDEGLFCVTFERFYKPDRGGHLVSYRSKLLDPGHLPKRYMHERRHTTTEIVDLLERWLVEVRANPVTPSSEPAPPLPEL